MPDVPGDEQNAGGREEKTEFWRYNRRKIREWLYYFRDLFEEGYVASGVPVEGSGGEGRLDLLDPARMDRMQSVDQSVSHKVLLAAKDALQRRRWALYMRISTAYFVDDPNPGLPDVWEDEAKHASLADRLAWTDHEAALDFLADFVEEELPRWARTDEGGEVVLDEEGRPKPRRKLTVEVPIRVRGERARWRKQRRAAALELFYVLRQDLRKGDAIRLAAKRTGYSTKEVRVIVRKAERDGAPS